MSKIYLKKHGPSSFSAETTLQAQIIEFDQE